MTSFKTIEALAASYGFALHRSKKHLVWKHKGLGTQVVTPKTSSDFRGIKNMERLFKRYQNAHA